MRRLEEEGRVYKVRAAMCRYNLQTWTKDGGTGWTYTPTGLLTNSACAATMLSRRCLEDHEHVHLLNGRARNAQEYPMKLCQAICKAILQQQRYDEKSIVGTKLMETCQLTDAIMMMVDGEAIKADKHGIDSVTVRCMERGAGGDNEVLRHKGDWPGGCRDRLHEEDGMDKYGGRIRDGRKEMEELSEKKD